MVLIHFHGPSKNRAYRIYQRLSCSFLLIFLLFYVDAVILFDFILFFVGILIDLSHFNDFWFFVLWHDSFFWYLKRVLMRIKWFLWLTKLKNTKIKIIITIEIEMDAMKFICFYHIRFIYFYQTFFSQLLISMFVHLFIFSF